MTGKEHTIFKSYLFWTSEEEEKQKECIRQIIEEDAIFDGEDADFSEERIEQRFLDDLDLFYEDAEMNLSKKLPNNIIGIADIGRWNGRTSDYVKLGNNLNEVLYAGNSDDIHVYCDRYNVCSELADHDGSTYVTYRMVKDGVDVDKFLGKVYNGTCTKKDITRYTKSLRPYIKLCYGW